MTEALTDDAAELRRQRDDLSAEMERCHRLLDRHYGEDESTTALDTLEDRLKTLLDESAAALSREREARERAEGEVGRLTSLIDTPHTADFMGAVPLEAAHQIKRWGVEHDDGKAPEDWFWVVGYLAGKALHHAKAGNVEKAKHHTISTAAVMLNWFRRLSGDDQTFRPGIAEPKGYAGKGPECEYCEREATESIGNVIVCDEHFKTERPA